MNTVSANKYPEVSVVIPAYNTAQYIRDTLDSVYAQTYFLKHSFEVLVGVDKCRTTYNELVRLSPRYPNLRIIMMKSNGGPFIIRNTLISLARADIISCFDSDDIMLPDLIERCMVKLRSGKWDAVQYRVLSFHDGKPLSTAKPTTWCNEGSMVLFKHCYEPTGGYKPWRCAADTEFRNRLVSCRRLTKLEEPGYYYRRRAAALTSARETGFKSNIRKKYKEEIQKGFTDPYVEPVTGEHEITSPGRLAYTLNIFSNCTGNSEWKSILEHTVTSFRETFGFADRVRVFLDRNPYTEFEKDCVDNLNCYDVTVTDSLLEGYKRSVIECEHEFAFQLEHDWEFYEDRIKHDTTSMFRFMKERSFCHMRFNKRKNMLAGWDKQFRGGKGMFPHCISDQLSNNPHILNISLYRGKVLPMLKKGKGSKGIEEVISWKGISGVVYGALGSEPSVKHIDGRKTLPAEKQVHVRKRLPEDKVTSLFKYSVFINMDIDVTKYIRTIQLLTELKSESIRVQGIADARNPALGCAKAHKRALVTAEKQGWPFVLVMEDDLVPLNNIEHTISLLKLARGTIDNMDFDILYLGFTPDEDAVRLKDNIYRVGDGWGAYAYILPKKNFRHAINLLPQDEAVGIPSGKLTDSVLTRNMKEKLFIPVFGVSGSYSNIKKKNRLSLSRQIVRKHRRFLKL